MDISMLNSVIADATRSYPSGLDKDEQFEFFCADKLLTNYDVSYDEISAGIVDGKGDGGIDAAYLFIDRRLVNDEFDYSTVGDEPVVELVLIQSKNTTSFSESPIDKLHSVLNSFLFNTPTATTLAAFKPEIADIFKKFQEARASISGKFPSVAVHTSYCARAMTPPVSVIGKADALRTALTATYPTSTVNLVGVARLYELAKEQKTLTIPLPTVGQPLNVTRAMVGLVKLADFAKFISDEHGLIINRIFDANVRDYQGDVEVNKEISSSLTPSSKTEFWWMNNGVTIVADKAQYDHPNIMIKNPLIVNGLQTSFEIHSRSSSLKDDPRNVLVKVIEETDQTEREKIIRATNRQTAIKASSFRASDGIHIKIEDFLKSKQYFYDRRKNAYKRMGKPADRIISIDRMTQALLAVYSQSPETARARPGNALRNDTEYSAIFAEDADHPIALYGVVTILLMQVEAYFRSIRKTTDRVLVNNMKFHTLMVLAWNINGSSTLPGKRIAQLDPTTVTDTMLGKVTSWVFAEFSAAGMTDQIARDKAFTSRLRTNWTPAATA